MIHNFPLPTTSNFATLLYEKNAAFVAKYKKNSLMQLINSPAMEKKSNRERLLACIQVFSNYFQKTIMLRNVFCETPKFVEVTQEHLAEEFGHNLALLKDRNNKPPHWDPILEATSAWFVWKMFTLDNEEKTILVHFVLESSANIFFQAAHKVMTTYGETDYFKIHSDADERHEQMGRDLIKNISQEKYEKLILIQQQGWDMLTATSNQIAKVTLYKELS